MGLQERVKNFSGHLKRNETFLAELTELASQGLPQNEIAIRLGCAQGTVSTYWPAHITKRRRGYQRVNRYIPKDVAEKFPVHPEVVLAKEQLVKAFAANPFDAKNFALCCQRLENLVGKHHPIDQRPLKQRK